jgi:hypothetical protein
MTSALPISSAATRSMISSLSSVVVSIPGLLALIGRPLPAGARGTSGEI